MKRRAFDLALAFRIEMQHEFRLVAIIGNDNTAHRAQMQIPEHVTRRERGEQHLVRIVMVERMEGRSRDDRGLLRARFRLRGYRVRTRERLVGLRALAAFGGPTQECIVLVIGHDGAPRRLYQ